MRTGGWRGYVTLMTQMMLCRPLFALFQRLGCCLLLLLLLCPEPQRLGSLSESLVSGRGGLSCVYIDNSLSPKWPFILWAPRLAEGVLSTLASQTCAFNAEVLFPPSWNHRVARTQTMLSVQLPQLRKEEPFNIIFIGSTELFQNLALCKTFVIFFFSSKLRSLKSLELCWHCICSRPVHRSEHTPHLTYTCRKKKTETFLVLNSAHIHE